MYQLKGDRTVKIIHVDDDSDTRRAVGAILEQYGYDVVGVPDGQSCLNEIRKGGRPDIILLDMMMPGDTGWDIFQKIRKRHGSVMVVFLSVMPISGAQKQKFLDAGVADYITKPFTEDELIGRIRKIIATGHERQIVFAETLTDAKIEYKEDHPDKIITKIKLDRTTPKTESGMNAYLIEAKTRKRVPK